LTAVELEWLGNLETRVREAAARLTELREENRTLRQKIKDLETRAATLFMPPAEPEARTELDEEVEALRVSVRDLEDQLAAAETERADAAAAAKSLEIEREEVRRRVEGLVERLEGLVET
jgi:phage shock protein A